MTLADRRYNNQRCRSWPSDIACCRPTYESTDLRVPTLPGSSVLKMRLVFVNPDSRGSALDATVSAHGRGPRPLVGNRRRRARLPRSTHGPPWPPGCLLGVDNGVTRALFFTLWVQVIEWAGRGTGRAFTPMGKKLPQRIPPGNGRVQGEVSPEAPPRHGSHDVAILAPTPGSGTCGYQGAQKGGPACTYGTGASSSAEHTYERRTPNALRARFRGPSIYSWFFAARSPFDVRSRSTHTHASSVRPRIPSS